MAETHWIKGAIKRPGALSKKAAKAGQSPIAFARAHTGDPGKTGQQARLAVTLSRLHNRSTRGSPSMTAAELRQGYRTLS